MALRHLTITIALSAATCFFDVDPAQAEFKVCNQTLNLYNLAIGVETAGEFHTEGWWTISANACVTLIKGTLNSRFVYVFATNIYGDDALSGEWDMCIDSRKFYILRIKGEAWNCWLRGYQQVKFKEVDTGKSASWTVFIREGQQ